MREDPSLSNMYAVRCKSREDYFTDEEEYEGVDSTMEEEERDRGEIDGVEEESSGHHQQEKGGFDQS